MLDINNTIIGILIIGGLIIFSLTIWRKETKQWNKNDDKKKDKEKSKVKEINKDKENKIKAKLRKVDKLKVQISEVQNIKVIDISDYKKIIVDNEKIIIEKGGDKLLFTFLKIDAFLNDFRLRIVDDKYELQESIDIDWLKSKIIEEFKRRDIEKVQENLEDITAKLESRKTKGFDANIDKLFDLGNKVKPAMENQIKTMEYYKNMARAMIVFYLNDKKIRYFEIHEAFEKLGVFDSTWQKNVLNKLDSIETRLAQISNQLSELNTNFIYLVESSEHITSELKEINSTIITNNTLQAISAYQMWRINKNTKSLIN